MAYIFLAAILIAFIIFTVIFIIKNFSSPQKLDGIKKAINDGKYQQAQRLAKSLITKNSKDYVAHYYLGKAYMADKKPELAFIEYKTVNQNAVFNGDIPELEFRKQMAELYKLYNQNDDALKEYLLLTKMEPSNAENDFNVGKIYEAQGKAGLAMGFYQKTITANKKHPQAHTAMGHLLYRSKQYNEAKKEIDTAIKLNPENYSNYYYLGKILKEMKNLPAAVKSFEKAQRDSSLKQKALIEKGTCLMIAGQIDQAQDDFDRAIKVAKDENAQETLYARYFLAACYEKNRKIENAIEQWEAIFKNNRQFKDVGVKLSQYKDLQTNDNMKEYLTCSNSDFLEMCKKITNDGLNLDCQKIEPTKFGCQLLAIEKKKGTWMNVRQQIFLVLFFRETQPLEDSVVRKVVDTVKNAKYEQGIIVSSSQFSASAVKFAENRAVTLVSKEKLENLFTKAGL
ncbi:MAG: tetratricopeptide repeat protein [Treponema sp.]|nr:tetratricopeptide repeat protein [Spirochaetales bacterium]MDY4902247.1 tetratricopeptide repeat protein [Treponema sp.]